MTAQQLKKKKCNNTVTQVCKFWAEKSAIIQLLQWSLYCLLFEWRG